MSFYLQMREKMLQLVKTHALDNEEVAITTKALTPEEAIGKTVRQDFPLLTGNEILMNAVFEGSVGQAFTDQPSLFRGSIKEVLSLDLDENNNRAIFIAASNAVLRHLGLISDTVHCKNEEPELCAEKMKEWLLERYQGKKIALVGLQPSILDNLRTEFEVRALDICPDNIGKEKYGIVIEDGEKTFREVMDWADVLVATGSMVVNGTILNYLKPGKPIYFFGTTIAGAAYLQGFERLCFCAK